MRCQNFVEQNQFSSAFNFCVPITSGSLFVDQRHHDFRIPRAGGRAVRRDILNLLQICLRQFHVCRAGVVFQKLTPLRTGNRDNVRSLRQQPSEGKLARGAILFLRERLNLCNEVEIFLKILSLKARRIPSIVVFVKIFKLLELSREKSAAERTVATNAMPSWRVVGKTSCSG